MKKTVTIALTVIFTAILLLVSNTNINDLDGQKTDTTDSENEDDFFTITADNNAVPIIDSLVNFDATTNDVKAVVLSNSWIQSHKNEAENIINKTIISGLPVITTGNNTSLFETIGLGISLVFDQETDVHALLYDASTGTSYCYSGDDQHNDLYNVVTWIDGINLITSGNMIVENGEWSNAIVSYIHREFDDHGEINMFNNYRYIIEDNYKYNYYAGINRIEIIPNFDSGYKTVSLESRIEASNQGDTTFRQLYDYSPTGTVGTTTYNASIGISAGTSGISLNASLSWQYSLSDIIVHNYSNYDTGDFHLKFDFFNFSAEETRIVSPGHLTIVNCDDGYFKNGDYLGSEKYTATFKNSKNEESSFDIDLFSRIKANPCTINYDSNGADENIFNPELISSDLNPIGDVYSETYSQGAHISIWDVGYRKNGFSPIGYSYDIFATEPEFHFGDKIKIIADQTLYAIWQEEEQ